MVETDHAAVDSPDVMAINPPAPLHSAEMAEIDIATTSVTAAISQPTNNLAVMVDPPQVSSADTVDTTQLSFAEMVNVTPAKSFVMKDKPLKLAEEVETASPFLTSAEKVEATTSQIKKCVTPSIHSLTERCDKLFKEWVSNQTDANRTAYMKAYVANSRAKREQEINERKMKS